MAEVLDVQGGGLGRARTGCNSEQSQGTGAPEGVSLGAKGHGLSTRVEGIGEALSRSECPRIQVYSIIWSSSEMSRRAVHWSLYGSGPFQLWLLAKDVALAG